MKYRITKPRRITADVALPSSKSISNRALVMNALSGAPVGLVSNVSDCDDTTVMKEALFLLEMERREGEACMLPPVVDVKAAGTAMRFLTALLAVSNGTHTITGTERMRHRPIGVLVDALRALGADITYEGEEGFPPLRITGKTLRGGELSMAGNVSSQYISALLMIAPLLAEGLTLHLQGTIVSRPYINMTLAMMREHGVEAKWMTPSKLFVAPKAYQPTSYQVEADWSAASYWYEMLLLNENRHQVLTLRGLQQKSLQGDSAVEQMFRQLSVNTLYMNTFDEGPKVVIFRRGRVAQLVDWDFTHTPDLAQTMVVTCAMKGIPFRFRGLQSLRIKETDRIAALQTELAKLGVRVEVEGDSTIRWAGPEGQPPGEIPYLKPLPGTAIDTYDDHRMAMAFAPAALVLGSIDINDPQVVSKSYPRFWEDLEKAGLNYLII
ncbi:MAG: 3-phosphoshikimate 1-carboxyvinyltransferase [Bacteroidales bacterium]|nr:3-phosphoshikimate 1-carboxyvinyltransferase [Bacteroidales bacterium]